MGKKKISAYELFVKEACGRMRREGHNPNYVEQLGKLGTEFKSLPEDVKQYYRDRAKNPDGFYPRPAWAPRQPAPCQASSSGGSGADTKYGYGGAGKPYHSDQPSTSGSQSYGGPSDVKPNSSFNTNGAEPKPNIDSTPVIKEERGQKRKLEVYVQDGQSGQQDEAHDHQEPPKKKGFGIPNWKNMKNSTQPEADLYFDYHKVEKRNLCESIVETHIEDLLDFPLYSFSCNVLCKYKDTQGSQAKYVPLEIGICTYTIRNGQIGEPFHAIIDSGPPPSNHWGDTSDHIRDTHKIQVTRDGKYPPGSRNDYRRLYKEMTRYVRDGERTILVADKNDLEQVQSCIEWIYEQFAVQDEILTKPSTWTILPLVEFVAAAHKHVYCKLLKYPLPKFTLYYFLMVRLETSIWDYQVEFMCDYHKRDDFQSKWCAKNCAIRAFKAIELTLDEIYRHYLQHQEIESSKPEPTGFGAPPNGSGMSRAQNATTNGGQTVSHTYSAPRRQHAQQIQQPLHMPKDEPAPLIEDKARRDEIWRQQLETARAHLQPAPYYEGYYEIPPDPTELPETIQPQAQPEQVPSVSAPLAIEQTANKPHTEEEIKRLDPRLSRNA